MKTLLLCTLSFAIIFSACQDNGHAPQNDTKHTDGSFFNGSWTYRSLFNDTAWQTDFDSLEFAAAIMDLKTTGKDSITGLLYWSQNPTQGLKISGRYYYNDSTTCYYLVGVGDSSLGTPGWQYDYQGYIVPHWSFGVNQVDALVGSVARFKPHNGEPAGVVASTYMVRRSK